MNAVSRALVAGFAGALSTNLAHEILRRLTPDAPRVDLLGMQALAKLYKAADTPPAVGKALYVQTLFGDIAANTMYFSLAALAGRNSLALGSVLGVVAGVGAYAVPPAVDLDEKPTGRTASTKAWTVALYSLGGVVAGAMYATSGSE